MIDFPTSPLLGEAYTYVGRTWVWNGDSWERQVNSGQNVSVFTVTGILVTAEVNNLSFIANDFHQITYI